MTHYTILDSPVGKLLLLASDTALTGLYFADYPHAPLVQKDWLPGGAILESAAQQLREYFAGERTAFDLPLQPEGTEFQKQVWQAVYTIPHGQRRSYKEIATSIGRPTAARAVGTAIGQNPICVIGPCHRVVTSSGKLGGYAGGVAYKTKLLQLEARSLAL
jgi:methylated-DNA-[protein]-cysteine S-methyltransferase